MSNVDLIMDMETFGRLTKDMPIPSDKKNDYKWLKENVSDYCADPKLAKSLTNLLEEILARLPK